MMYESWRDAIEIIPDHMRDGVMRYLERGIAGGSFQEAIFSNDLLRACQAADWVNRDTLFDWGEFLLYCPHGSYGSHEAVAAWCKAGGLMGRATTESDDA